MSHRFLPLLPPLFLFIDCLQCFKQSDVFDWEEKYGNKYGNHMNCQNYELSYPKIDTKINCADSICNIISKINIIRRGAEKISAKEGIYFFVSVTKLFSNSGKCVRQNMSIPFRRSNHFHFRYGQSKFRTLAFLCFLSSNSWIDYERKHFENESLHKIERERNMQQYC